MGIINGNTLPICNINNGICNRSQDDKLTGYMQLRGMRLRQLNCCFKKAWMKFSLFETSVAKYHPYSEKVWFGLKLYMKKALRLVLLS